MKAGFSCRSGGKGMPRPRAVQRLANLSWHLQSSARLEGEVQTPKLRGSPDQHQILRDGLDISGAVQALQILREFQGARQAPSTLVDSLSSAARAGAAEMSATDTPLVQNLPGFVGCEVGTPANGLAGFSEEEVQELQRKLHRRGALLLRGLPGDMDHPTNAQALANFLNRFGESQPEFPAETKEQWHPALPEGSMQRFSNDKSGTLLEGSGRDDMLAWHFDGEFNPWWTAHTALFCERAAFAGHSTGYCSQRAAFLAAALHTPELIWRLRNLYSLCCLEGISVGSGNPGRIDFQKHYGDSREDAELQGNLPWDEYPPQFKPIIRKHHCEGYECFSAVLAYITEFAEHRETQHMCQVVEYEDGNFNSAPRIMRPSLSADLLGALLRFITQDRFRYFHQWQCGDLLIWDNLACLHTVMPWDYKNNEAQLRIMWRTTQAVDDFQTPGDGSIIRTPRQISRVEGKSYM